MYMCESMVVLSLCEYQFELQASAVRTVVILSNTKGNYSIDLRLGSLKITLEMVSEIRIRIRFRLKLATNCYKLEFV